MRNESFQKEKRQKWNKMGIVKSKNFYNIY